MECISKMDQIFTPSINNPKPTFHAVVVWKDVNDKSKGFEIVRVPDPK